MLVHLKRALLITMLTTACDDAPSQNIDDADLGILVDAGSSDVVSSEAALPASEDLGLDAETPVDAGLDEAGFDAA